MSSREIVVAADLTSVSREMAVRMVPLAREAIRDRGRFALALSGGSTPKELHTQLASEEFRNQFDWSRIHFFWGDERCVPPDHEDSNYRMAHETVLSKVPVPAENVHRIPAELDGDVAAAQYEAELGRFFGAVEWPRFDLILLGMGPDGHTASLFPKTQALSEEKKWVVHNAVPQQKINRRITLTYPVLDAARLVAFLVCGKDKTDTLRLVLEGPEDPITFPSQKVQPVDGRLLWILDQAAAEKLTLTRA